MNSSILATDIQWSLAKSKDVDYYFLGKYILGEYIIC